MERDSVRRLPARHNGGESWRRRVTIACGVAALSTYIALGLFSLHQSYEREMDFARHSQENLARVLERHAANTIEKIDTVLVASQLRLNAAFAGEAMEATAINAALSSYLDLIQESQSLRVADENGHFIFDASGSISNATITDRAYFQRSAESDGRQLIISEPIFARITRNWVITLSRRIDDGHGGFGGLIQAAVRADHFESFYSTLKFASPQSVTLIDDQLRLVARYPLATEKLGKPIDSASLRKLVAEGKSEGIYTASSGIDGVERLYAVRKVGKYPLYVIAGRATDDFLGSWYQQVKWTTISALILAIVLTGWIVVWLRTYDEARRLARGMTEAYETTLRRNRALLDSLPDPAWLTDRSQRMIAVNEAYVRASGQEKTQILGRTVDEIWPERTASSLRQQDSEVRSSRTQQTRTGSQEIAGGDIRHFEYISTPVLDELGEIAGVAGVARDITQMYEDQARIRHLAEHDILTDLPNRALLETRMSAALVDALGDQVQIALLFLDLDHFKFVNDTLGHTIGDQLLLQVAQRMRDNLDERDTISRQGGDEFAVLLQGFNSLSRVATIAQRLIDLINQPFVVDGRELLIGASIGISTYPRDGADIGTLLKNADTAMYQAKAAGGNGYRFFTPEMNVRISERVDLENSLRRAILAQEFRLHYQPQVDGNTGRLIGLEALIRWQHPDRGEIPPARFIPIAEESNLIDTIGEWVLHEACRQSRAWRDQGYPPVVVAVNVSAVQLRQRNLAAQVSTALAANGLDAAWLELEITESAFIGDTERIVETLHELHALGVKLSVDDFGTGYSSLGYLKRLPFSRIKIDQSFVRDLPGNEDDAAIIKAIIGIAHNMQKEVIAEGVEETVQRDYLIAHGCYLMQGFHFGRPMAAAELGPWLTRCALSEQN
ncbi:EAL domain-containing protein [Azoarcus sp. L1K30]|uniref:bifunctional diguanylate cyclase/phosphodiesterase n=1 Tax=Azoarcus sp. L1K30 TaxID=2820277 RepID=UPI001B82CC23|nr:EAL domain-containing protein [Azoarcus sp. L1K30]MBR0565062.1 EAL domain-containing protein [Azoarcus sp. L1K30]